MSVVLSDDKSLIFCQKDSRWGHDQKRVLKILQSLLTPGTEFTRAGLKKLRKQTAGIDWMHECQRHSLTLCVMRSFPD